MKIRRKRADARKMWFDNVTIKINDDMEMEAELEIVHKMIIIDYTQRMPGQLNANIYIIDCELLHNDGDPVDVVKLMVHGDTLVTVRFASEQSKIDFLEAIFHDRSEDSANSSDSSTPSPPENQNI